MSLTPTDVYNRDFEKKFRGYNEQEVDDFLDLVAAYYEELLSENNRLKVKVEEQEQEIEHYKNLESSLDETMNKAQEMIDSRKDEAEKEAELILKDAKLKAKQIVQDAELKAKKLIQQSETKVEDKYRQYQELVEHEKLFKIRFKTFLKSHLEMLEENKVDLEAVKKEIAATE